MIDYTELKRLAEGLLETEWYTRLDLPPCSLAESEFIAAANPATVLALIAENESLSLKHAEAGRLYLELAAERDQLKADKEALVASYARAGEREHELRVDRQTLRLALKYAVEMFNRMSSADGSGHADIGRAVLKLAGAAMGEPS